MVSAEQQRFLLRVSEALGHKTSHYRSELFESTLSKAEASRPQERNAAELQELLGVLMSAAQPLNIQVVTAADEEAVARSIVALAREKKPEWGTTKCIAAWRHPLIDRLRLADRLAGSDIGLIVPTDTGSDTGNASLQDPELRERMGNAFIGVTSADYCLADTATLVLKTRPGQGRAVSLLPTIHVAVIGIERIIANFRELLDLQGADPEERSQALTNCMTLITGPSKTGDIELVMVHGAHGPRELHLYVITG